MVDKIKKICASVFGYVDKNELRDLGEVDEKLLLTHLETLQDRISRHGARMWQLPLTYLAAIAGSATLLDEDISEKQISIVFGVLAALGVAFALCFFGAKEGYVRAARDLRAVEDELFSSTYSRSPWSHIWPYFLLIVLGMLSSLVACFMPEILLSEA